MKKLCKIKNDVNKQHRKFQLDQAIHVCVAAIKLFDHFTQDGSKKLIIEMYNISL